MCGCYEALEGGTIEEALALLTGFPTERLSLQGSEQPSAYAAAADISFDGADRDVLWSRLLSAHEAGYLCGASCGAAGGGGRDAAAISAAAEAMGLLTEHAYSVLQAGLFRSYPPTPRRPM